MHYYSTRGQDGPLGYEEALLSGLARDGGLYLPEAWPKFSHEDIAAMQGLSYAELAGRLMHRSDIFMAEFRPRLGQIQAAIAG